MKDFIHLETRRIRLREIGEKDLPVLFQWRSTEKYKFFLSHHRNRISFEEFTDEFAGDSSGHKYQFLVERKTDKMPVGFAFVNNFSEQYKSCFINVFITEPFEQKGYGVDAFISFVLYLFKCAGLKKLFAGVLDFNEQSISCLRRSGMKELEGNVTKIVIDGKECNLICFAGDQNMIPGLTRVNEFLSKPLSIPLNQ